MCTVYCGCGGRARPSWQVPEEGLTVIKQVTDDLYATFVDSADPDRERPPLW